MTGIIRDIYIAPVPGIHFQINFIIMLFHCGKNITQSQSIFFNNIGTMLGELQIDCIIAPTSFIDGNFYQLHRRVKPNYV